MYKKGSCWEGYVQKGMKKKGNRMVPNCVPAMKTGGLTKWFNEKMGRYWKRERKGGSSIKSVEVQNLHQIFINGSIQNAYLLAKAAQMTSSQKAFCCQRKRASR
jgi:hypothetical protein